jgi:imidazolonepropionase-like amidohydrolase
MHTHTRLLTLSTGALLAATLTLDPLGASAPVASIYAVKGARIFTAAGAPIENGTVLIRNGVIEEIGATVTVPPDAIVIDATGMNMYPGLIDMTNDAPIEAADGGPAGLAVAPAGRRRTGRHRRPRDAREAERASAR